VQLEIHEVKRGNLLVLAPRGRLDTSTSRDLQERLLALLSQGERHLVVDFGTIEHVSSAGLRVLLMLARRLGSMEGALVLCSLNAVVREVFEVSGFSRIFVIEPDRDAALQRLLKGEARQEPRRSTRPKSETAVPTEERRHLAELARLASDLLARTGMRGTAPTPSASHEALAVVASLLGKKSR
jgi:anti-anti-sigma factor